MPNVPLVTGSETHSPYLSTLQFITCCKKTNMAGISSGQILRIKELIHLGASLDGKSVRTWGRALTHNIARSQLKVCDEGIELIIDTSFVEPTAFNRGSLYQFIGEVYVSENIILRARIATCIDGMDMNLFNQALDIRRKYLQEDIATVS